MEQFRYAFCNGKTQTNFASERKGKLRFVALVSCRYFRIVSNTAICLSCLSYLVQKEAAKYAILPEGQVDSAVGSIWKIQKGYRSLRPLPIFGICFGHFASDFCLFMSGLEVMLASGLAAGKSFWD